MPGLGPGELPGAQPQGHNESMKSLPLRLRDLVIALLAGVAFFYLLLPLLNRTFPILEKTSRHLEQHGIDPTRYYYTDVSQVAAGEEYLRTALHQQEK
jgi:hypothetical protein